LKGVSLDNVGGGVGVTRGEKTDPSAKSEREKDRDCWFWEEMRLFEEKQRKQPPQNEKKK